MRDVDQIEAINREQLATATDRLLLRGRVARQRLARSSQAHIAVAAPLSPAPRAEGSQPGIGIPTPPLGPLRRRRAEGSQPGIEARTPRVGTPLSGASRELASHAADSHLRREITIRFAGASPRPSQSRSDVSSRAAGSLPWIEVQSPRGSAVHARIIVAPSLAHPPPPRRPLLPLQLFARR
jgi:hypothetical protein